MVSAPPKPKEPKGPPQLKPTQRRLIPEPKGDYRLLEPGWASELGPDELEFLLAELSRDKKLAFKWGFRASKKRPPEWAVRQVAMLGNPDNRKANAELTRETK